MDGHSDEIRQRKARRPEEDLVRAMYKLQDVLERNYVTPQSYGSLARLSEACVLDHRSCIAGWYQGQMVYKEGVQTCSLTTRSEDRELERERSHRTLGSS